MQIYYIRSFYSSFKFFFIRSIRRMFHKTNLIMKFSFIIMLIGTICVHANSGYAQSTRVNLQMKEASLADVFREIEKQSDYRFFYNNAVMVNTVKKFDLNVNDQSISTLLNEIFNETGTDWWKIILSSHRPVII